MPLRIAVNLNPYMRFVRNVGAFGLPPMRCRHEFFRKVCAKNTGTLWLTQFRPRPLSPAACPTFPLSAVHAEHSLRGATVTARTLLV